MAPRLLHTCFTDAPRKGACKSLQVPHSYFMVARGNRCSLMHWCVGFLSCCDLLGFARRALLRGWDYRGLWTGKKWVVSSLQCI